MKKISRTILGLALMLGLNCNITALAGTMYVNASNLNMRIEASMTGQVIQLLPRGTAVEQVQDLGEWSQVTVNGKSGYVATAVVLLPDRSPQTSVFEPSPPLLHQKYDRDLQNHLNSLQ